MHACTHATLVISTSYRVPARPRANTSYVPIFNSKWATWWGRNHVLLIPSNNNAVGEPREISDRLSRLSLSFFAANCFHGWKAAGWNYHSLTKKKKKEFEVKEGQAHHLVLYRFVLLLWDNFVPSLGLLLKEKSFLPQKMFGTFLARAEKNISIVKMKFQGQFVRGTTCPGPCTKVNKAERSRFINKPF